MPAIEDGQKTIYVAGDGNTYPVSPGYVDRLDLNTSKLPEDEGRTFFTRTVEGVVGNDGLTITQEMPDGETVERILDPRFAREVANREDEAHEAKRHAKKFEQISIEILTNGTENQRLNLETMNTLLRLYPKIVAEKIIENEDGSVTPIVTFNFSRLAQFPEKDIYLLQDNLAQKGVPLDELFSGLRETPKGWDKQKLPILAAYRLPFLGFVLTPDGLCTVEKVDNSFPTTWERGFGRSRASKNVRPVMPSSETIKDMTNWVHRLTENPKFQEKIKTAHTEDPLFTIYQFTATRFYQYVLFPAGFSAGKGGALGKALHMSLQYLNNQKLPD